MKEYLSVLLLLASAQWLTVAGIPVDANTAHPETIILDEATAYPETIILDDTPAQNYPLNENGHRVYQGDMLLTDEQWQSLLQRKAIADERYRWPKSADGLVNIDYRYDDAIVSRPGVELAKSTWEAVTCVRFHEVSTAVAKPHIIFKNSDSSCNSYVGSIFSQNGQDINLAPSCFNSNDTVVHELGHALGLKHEQSRSDRDDYLVILYENIVAGMEHNFNKENTNNYGLPYDYSSVMHYTPKAFSKNGEDTLVAKDPLAQPLIKDSEGLSFMDKKIVNLMYDCINKWLADCGLTTDPCQNQGYTNRDCTCECPAGTEGTNCETLNKSYVDALVAAKSPGSERITTEKVVTSPGFPTPVTQATNQVQSIEAPECHRVRLTFSEFRLYSKSTITPGTGDPYQACYWMALEIRLDDPPLYGTEYCQTEITAGQTFESDGRKMALIYSSRAVSNSYRGYSATVEFVPVTTGNCTPAATTTTEEIIPTTEEITTTPEEITTTPEEITTTPEEITTTPEEITTTPEEITTTPEEVTTTLTVPPSGPGDIINTGILPVTASSNEGQCRLLPTADPEVYTVRSPRYPNSFLSNDRCMIWFNTTEPRYLVLIPLVIDLGPSDVLNVSYPHETVQPLDPSMVRTAVTLPSASSKLDFQASMSSPGGKFLVRINVKNNDCHQLIMLQEGSTGTISIPENYPAQTFCEWWFRAPEGRQVQVSFSRFSIGGRLCKRDFVTIDVTGDTRYVSGATQYCGGNVMSPGTVVSTGNALNILMSGWIGNYRGMEATYSVV